MSKKKEYWFHKCRNCEIDFLLPKIKKRRVYCPSCGEYFFTEKVMVVWLERPFQYKRQWTAEEDDLVRTGKEAKYSAKRIAESLQGRTPGAINNRWGYLRDRKEKGDDEISLV